MEIVSTAQVKGKIVSAVLAIAEGAVHDGVIQMPHKKEVTRFQDKRSDTQSDRGNEELPKQHHG
jgi:hypothetical protein